MPKKFRVKFEKRHIKYTTCNSNVNKIILNKITVIINRININLIHTILILALNDLSNITKEITIS